MNIVTTSIRDNLEVQLNKPVESIVKEDLSNIKTMTVDRISLDGSIKKINYEELLYFENLEELNIFNCMIEQKLMNVIINLKNLRILKIYNCDFVDYINNFFSMINLEELVISNCLGIKNLTLENLKYLEIRNIDEMFSIKNVECLNISNTRIPISRINLINVKKVIISEKNYKENAEQENINAIINIIDDRLELVKEINNAQI